MRAGRGLALMIMGLGLLILASCEDFFYIDEEESAGVSKHGAMKSHHNGEDCMKCHSTGEMTFTIAGSVYDSTGNNPIPNVLIEFYSDVEGEGTLLHLLEGDALGNFYTTQDLNIEDGLYPVIIDEAGNRKAKNKRTNMGACNSCHGKDVELIWVE
ncbi:MAG: hypothetical protein K9I94_02150 [Bacteroidales bacterium]|nr:hypothetical protein [Bacteroidales bacterium]